MDHGSIFLSHASSDKEFVEKIYNRLDSSITFYDIKTIEPGQRFIDAMKEGVKGKNIFVLFHSPSTVGTWVEYERELAEVNFASKSSRIIVVPVGGETYKTLPAWMKGFMTCTEHFTASDIVRQILNVQESLIEEVEGKSFEIIGREEQLRKIHLKSIKNLSDTGSPLQHIVLSGLSGMGRRSVAKYIIKFSFSGMRSAGPIFTLPDMAESVDFYLALRQDVFGKIPKDELEEQIAAFHKFSFKEQAGIILEISKHWAEINQPIIFITKLGLRDRSRNLKPWFNEFLNISKAVPALRIFYISERRLPDEASVEIANLQQFYVDELSSSDIQYLLGKLIEAKFFSSEKIEKIAEHVHGHPATAHYVANLVNTGRNLDTLSANPEPIYAFQDRILGAILSSDLINEEQRKILALLGSFPRLSFNILARILEVPKRKISQDLWDLQEASLITASGPEYYSSPGVVANRSRKELSEISSNLIEEVRQIIQADVDSGKIDSQLIDALLIASVTPAGEIPKELSGLVTSSSLLSMVTDRFHLAREMESGAKEVFLSAYNLSKLAMGMPASDDAVEQILFTGGDSAIRAGIYPEDIITKMQSSAFPSVYYLLGSYEFHVTKNDEEAVRNLKIALRMKHFKLRNSRLLARALIRTKDFSGALKVIDDLPAYQVERETGLLIQKIRALHGMRNHKDANELERKLQGRDDEYGEIHIYNAGKALREQNFSDALSHLDRAEKCSKVNKFSHQLLKCAALIENRDPSMLPFMVETANSVNRKYDAYQLQARHAVVEGRWRDAESYLAEIEKKDYYDLQISLRMLKLKVEDPLIKGDALALQKCQQEMEDIVRQSATSPEGFRNA